LASKIKRIKIRRENIKDWLRGKHIRGWDILIPIDVLKELCKLNLEGLNEVIQYAIRFNPSWKDPNKKRYLIEKEKKIQVIGRGNEKYLDIFSMLPKETLPSTRSGKRLPLFCKVLDEEIELWSEANWKKSYVKLNRFISLDELFFVGSAIYSSEGTTKIGRYNDSISLGNSEPAIINLFFGWLNSFLKKYIFSVRVEFNGKNSNKEQLSNFWKSKVHFIRNMSIPVRERPELGSCLINNKGTLNIKVSGTVLKSFIISLLNSSKKIALTSEKYSLDYLKGLLASEGSVSRPKLKEVTIGCTNRDERKFIQKLLKKLRLKFTIGKNQFSIHGWKSFLFLYNNDVFDIPQINNLSKKSIFNEGFKNHQTTKGIIKLQEFSNQKFKAYDWQKKFNLKSYISAHKFLRKFVENGLLLTNFEDNIKIYYINPEKADFLKKIWGIQKL